MAIICFFFLLLCTFSVSEDCAIDNRTPDYSWEVKLHEDVITQCIDLAYKPPLNNGSKMIEVAVRFIVKRFQFYMNEEVFGLYMWTYYNWYDERLKWNPEDYIGIDVIETRSKYIWTPWLQVYNAVDFELDFNVDCTVKSTGKVRCVLRSLYEAPCASKLRNWPFDTQTCTLQFGPWTKPMAKIIYKYNGISLFGPEYGTGWTIINYNATANPNITEQISLTFDVAREAYGLAIVVVIPSIILCVLTLLALILNLNHIRLSISCLALTLHFYILTAISEAIPKHGADTPAILLFVRTSVVLATVCIIVTLFLQYLRDIEKPIPVWASNVNSYVFNSKFKYVIWPRWEFQNDILTVSENIEKNNSEEWWDLVNILNSLFIGTFMIIYVCLFLVYIPKPIPDFT